MIHRILKFRIVLCILLIAGSLNTLALKTATPQSIDKINSEVRRLSSANNISGLLSLADSLTISIAETRPDSSTMAELYYYIGVCNLLANKYNDAILNLEHSVRLKENLNLEDDHYLKSIYNIGVSYNFLGDYIQVSGYMLEYIRLGSKFYGPDNPEVAEAYSTLIGAAIECRDFDNFAEYTSQILGIIRNNKDAITGDNLSRLYTNIGVGFVMMADFSKARIYLEQAESLYENNPATSNINYINLINSLAVTYGSLGLSDKEDEYFNKGSKLAAKENSILAFNMVNSFAIALGDSGNVQKGEELLAGLVKRAYDIYGIESRNYIEVLNNYADFLLLYKKDIKKSLTLYESGADYLRTHEADNSLRDQVLTGYARALSEDGQPVEALEKIQDLLFYGKTYDRMHDPFRNPSVDSVQSNRTTLNILRLKYEVLWNIYSSSADQRVLEASANTSELIISIIDRLRISISEEESRIVLGNRYRDSYLMAIRDFELCYRLTGNRNYLEKAFEYAEKSKVAGLLAATRELNAIQLNIPSAAAGNEKKLQREIGFYNSRIAAENEKREPDKTLLALWNEKLLRAVNARDSLVLTFKKDYPGYFTMKYDTKTPTMNEIPALIGRKYNYINYIVSDSLLYIFIVNRKHQEVLTFKTDTIFLNNLIDFRTLLSSSAQSENARTGFENYNNTGYELYKILIEPVSKYLISDELLISPDNILSYLPFETILTSKYSGNEILYRKLNYLMEKYNISYTYSATFMEEVVSRNYSRMHELVAFGPNYKQINLDSLLSVPKTRHRVLYDLPNARQEAQYVAGISNGKLYLNTEARESVFKTVAGQYDIIHLAMHTFLDDINPMNSAMIFTQENDLPEDGLLYTYEVYGIPLKARLVVLSSCNTGSGKLYEGEGILSLARGFLYSGSESVVMSMWEIEDKSGTDIIKSFYDNLKRGKSKSEALKKARSSYLKNASQLKSHPYFWSSLVVYGNNSPVYVSRFKILAGVIILLLILSGVFGYFRYRRYS